MINLPLEKLLFIDIETVGIAPTFSVLKKDNTKLSSLFEHYESWFKKRFPEDEKLNLDELFLSRTSLVPEFAKIVCVCIRAIDTREIWQFGQYASISTLDLMCGVMDVESSKSEEMDGSKVHEVFWNEKNLEKISNYCEKDVIVLYKLMDKLLKLK